MKILGKEVDTAKILETAQELFFDGKDVPEDDQQRAVEEYAKKMLIICDTYYGDEDHPLPGNVDSEGGSLAGIVVSDPAKQEACEDLFLDGEIRTSDEMNSFKASEDISKLVDDFRDGKRFQRTLFKGLTTNGPFGYFDLIRGKGMPDPDAADSSDSESGEAITTTGMPEYDNDGKRVVTAFVPKKKEDEVETPHGSVLAEGNWSNVPKQNPETKKDEKVYEANGQIKASLSQKVYADDRVTVIAEGSWRRLGAPALDLHSNDAVSRGEYPRVPSSNKLMLDVKTTIALDGSTEAPKTIADFISHNDLARKVEKTFKARWGADAAEIYLSSVLRPQFANAQPEDFRKVWNLVIKEGSALVENYLSDGTLDGHDASQWANLFAYDPAGMVQLIALVTGQKDEAVQKALQDEGVKFEEFIGDVSEENFEVLITAVNEAEVEKTFELPEEYDSKEDPSTLALFARVLKFINTDALESQMATVDEDSSKELKETVKDSSNPWMAQSRLNNFMQEYSKLHVSAKWFNEIKVGNQMYGAPRPGLGVSDEIYRKFFENGKEIGKLGLSLYLGTPACNPGGDLKVDACTDGGMAWGLGSNGSYPVYESGLGVFRGLGVSGGATYASGKKNIIGESGGSVLTLDATVEGALSTEIKEVSVNITPKLNYTPLWNFPDGSATTSRHFLTPSLNFLVGGHYYLDNSLTRSWGIDDGELGDVIGAPGTLSRPVGSTAPSGNRAITLQDIGILQWEAAIVGGYQWKDGVRLGAGYNRISASNSLTDDGHVFNSFVVKGEFKF
ncbi:MAG: hypothetical protein Q7T03_10835 [Deltaproteobacteria bacterium]|nr:hypothetical protein [Deltaproteobacteria bacterium]